MRHEIDHLESGPGLSLRNPNRQSVPCLPRDHPHAADMGTENGMPSNGRIHRGMDRAENPKRSKSTVSLRSLVGGESKTSRSKSRIRERSPEKRSVEKRSSPKKTLQKPKSSTGLSALFGKRNKSTKEVNILATEQVAEPERVPLQTPIYAAFATPMDSQPQQISPRVRTDVSEDKLRHVKAEMDLYMPREYTPTTQRDFGAKKPALSRPQSALRPQSAVLTPSSLANDLHVALLQAQRNTLGSRGIDKSIVSVKDFWETHNGIRATPTATHLDLTQHASGSSTDQSAQGNINISKRTSRVAAAVAAIDGGQTSPAKSLPPKLDSRQIEKDFESMLERRNIPEDQRRTMRSLTLHVKADFIRQDDRTSRPSSPIKSSVGTSAIGQSESKMTLHSEGDGESKSPTKRERPRSRTFNFTRSGDGSPKKRQKSATRSPSENQHNEGRSRSRDESAIPPSRPGSTSRSQTRHACPQEYVGYLKAMQDPITAEVGRVHKLRILLRNETVEWVTEFVEHEGVAGIIGLLNRIMTMEWREDHEDQLLHETLLCLKGLSTTRVALKAIENVADQLFPSLLKMIFDEERKGPSEYSTRGIIISVLFAHLSSMSSATTESLHERANKCLKYLSDPEDTTTQPLPFVLDMHERRPYRVWCRELANVTKEVFWIFLHHGNVVPLSSTSADTDDSRAGPYMGSCSAAKSDTDSPCTESLHPDLATTYTKRHFPTTRPPVPAAPYIGGVEWDATTYLTTHLDLLNGILASIPTSAARNDLRADLRRSGWEKVMGATLRTCKEKFYSSVHDALRTWVDAAAEDGWDVEFVRTGKGQEEDASRCGSSGSAASGRGGGGGKKGGKAGAKAVQLPTLGLGKEIHVEKKVDLEGWLV